MSGPAGEPTLPTLLHGRFGISRRVTAAALVALTIGAVLGVLFRSTDGGRESLVGEGPPAFNLLYDEDHVRPAEPAPGELARVEARGPAEARLAVRPLPDSDLPFFGGLPVFAERHLAALDAELDNLRVRSEGKARIWGQPGYRFIYRAGGPGGRVYGQDVLVYPDDTALRGGALLSFRQRPARGRNRARVADTVEEVRRAMRSFQFGTDRR